MTQRRPDLVIFVADQLRPDHLGFGGNDVVATPNLDRLAATGTVFDRTVVANPVCMPNRATIATGRWPSAHGTRTNGVPLDADSMTFMRSLQSVGYRTAAVGKLHFQTMGWPFEDDQLAEIAHTDPDLLRPEVADAWRRRHADGWDAFEDYERHRRERVAMPDDYYGFDDVDLVIGHGDRAGGHYLHWARDRGLDPLMVAGFEHATTQYEGWGEVYETAVPAELYPTSYVTERAIARVGEMADDDEPFLLFVSYPDPHHPFTPPTGWFDRHDPADMALPATFDVEHVGRPPHLQAMADARGIPNVDPVMLWAPTADQFRHALAAELGVIEFIDDSIGRVGAAIEASGRDTITMFTSDHGDAFGDHGLLLKHLSHQAGIRRVPLVVVDPSRPPGRDGALASSADIAPTILELTGAPHWQGIQGRSLVGRLGGRSTDDPRGRHEALLVEEDQPFGLPELPGPLSIRTLVTNDVRFTIHGGTDVVEYYDLARDPDELVNLAVAEPGHPRLAAATTHLLETVLATSDRGRRPVAAA